jgi:hypothetical protein
MPSSLARFLVVALLCSPGCGDDSASTSNGGGDSGGGGSGAESSDGGAPNGGGSTTSSPDTTSTMASMNTTTSNMTDPYAEARQLCIDTINELRATKGLPAYERWVEHEDCADQQATYDEMNDDPHGAIQGGLPSCGGGAQNECLGGGASGIVSCSGCDACNEAYDPNCPDCEFNGQTVCGHYVNMSALYYSRAACGFSSEGGWAVIDFQ